MSIGYRGYQHVPHKNVHILMCLDVCKNGEYDRTQAKHTKGREEEIFAHFCYL
jgi:hypothetical protein